MLTLEVAFRIIVLDVFCITVHCIIKVSDPGPSWPSCLLRVLVNFGCTNLFFFKTIRDIASKLTTLVHHHYFHKKTRVHNSVNVFVRIMALFLNRILVKFFVPPYFFPK